MLKKSSLVAACNVGLALLGFVSLVLTPLALAQDIRTTTRDGLTASIEALSGPYSVDAIGPDMAKIVFYRPQTDRQDNAVSLFVNGMYHTSLVGTGFSDLCIAPDEVELSGRLMKVSDGPKDGQEARLKADLNTAGIQYVRVLEQGARPVLQIVPAEVAQQEMQGSKRQVHTISRVIGATNCQLPAGAALIELPGDTLFEFARSDREGLSGKGVAALDGVAAQIKQNYGVIDRVRVLGHADPIGDPALNLVLSDRRALTVLQYLQEQGVNPKVALAVGMGSSQPVVDCGRAQTTQSIACNAPNRRVVVEVLGQEK